MTKTLTQRIAEHRKGLVLVSILLVVVLSLSAVVLFGRSGEEITYRDTQVQFGDLVVGISESGSVDIGTVDQVFELDMSALQRTGTSQSGSGSTENAGFMGGVDMGARSGGNMAGGLDMFDQIFGMAGGSNYTSSGEDSNLTISEVCVSAGQQVQEGDILYRLEEDSVSQLEEQLSSNVEKAKADLDAVYADQVLSRQTAQYTYDSSIAYGDYESTEYQATITSLQDTLNEKEEALEQARKSYAEYQDQLEQTIADYEGALEVLTNLEWTCDNIDKWDNTYEYITNFQLSQTAGTTVENLEQKKEQLEKNVEQAQKNADTCTQERNAAKRALYQGLLSAEQTQKLRQLAYSTAQETYDLALSYLEEDAAKQEEIYQEAMDKWEEFSSHIKENAICAKYSGIITSVDLAEGDSIQTNDTLVTLYDLNEVGMTVAVGEDDMTDIALGTQANIALTAYPDQVFEAAVTEISDATTDSSGNVKYEVTVTLEGDVSGLFQGMTGEITFITKETREVLYVSNRAVFRERTKSYVKVKDADGSIRKQQVTTGFSDGINVEIKEGLSEGDTVYIESKVGES